MAVVRESSWTETAGKLALRGVLTSRVPTGTAAKSTPPLFLAAPFGGQSGLRSQFLALPRVWAMRVRPLTGLLRQWRATLVGPHVVAAVQQILSVRLTYLLWM